MRTAQLVHFKALLAWLRALVQQAVALVASLFWIKKLFSEVSCSFSARCRGGPCLHVRRWEEHYEEQQGVGGRD